MSDNQSDLIKLIRTDPLTGAGNMISFYESLFDRIDHHADQPFYLISADMKGLGDVNDAHGREVGDTALRWFTLVLQEQTGGEVFRLGGDDFAVIVPEEPDKSIRDMIEVLIQRLNMDAYQVNLKSPPANVAVIHYKQLTEMSLNRIIGTYYYVIEEKKVDLNQDIEILDADEVLQLDGLDTGSLKMVVSPSTLSMIKKIATLGALLNKSLRMAYMDSVSGLPNMNAANQYFETLIQESGEKQAKFTILLIDGDNLSKYNDISYMIGDEMIRNLGTTLKDLMRPEDYLARWRAGDEFIVGLPNSTIQQAEAVGIRLKENIKSISQGWQFPITVSIGIASYPDNGTTMMELVNQSERALRQAKADGKDSVAVLP